MLTKHKKYMLYAFIVLITAMILLFLGWNIFLSRWRIKTTENINSVNLRFTLRDSYSEALITDHEEINNIINLVLDMENKINVFNIVGVKEFEKFQSDPQVALTFKFEDKSQEICIQKDSVVIFDYCIDSNYDDMYFLRLENIDTDKLLNVLYLYADNAE